jgi:ribosomal-protein-alanine N-acetyltransferase
MVARPPVRLVIEAMRLADLPDVHEIERRSFRTPWPSHAYRTELETNRLAHYLVVRADGRVIAYAGIWLMVDEAHVTTFAVDPVWRRRHVGEALLLATMDLAIERGAREATLEVRLSNLAARRLYEKYGFRPVGIRPHYYSDDNEDALVMTTEALGGERMRHRLARLRDALEAAPSPEAPTGWPAATGSPAAGGGETQ